jgi:hypothetical protein
VLAALLALSAVGCGEDDGILVADGPVVAWSLDAEPDGMDAFASGTLVLDDGCLLLDGEDGTAAIVWPRDTTWDSYREAVVSTDGKEVLPGDPVMVGGGYVGIDDDTEVASTARDLLDDDCDPSSNQLIVSAVDSAIDPMGS